MQGVKERTKRADEQTTVQARHSARRGYQYRRRTRVRRVVVEFASLHPLEAEGVPAQRCVRHELRLELADGDRHLPTAETAAIDRSAAPIRKPLVAICFFQPGLLELLIFILTLSLEVSPITILVVLVIL